MAKDSKVTARLCKNVRKSRHFHGTKARFQGLSVLVKHDAQMHHGQNGGRQKNVNKANNVNFEEIGRNL